MQVKVGVKCVVTNNAREVLLLRRNSQISWMTRKGGWDFPGGALDQGEQPSETVVGEINEETGLKINDVHLVSAQTLVNNNQESVLILVYFAYSTSANIILSMEHDAYTWVTVTKIKHINCLMCTGAF